MTPEAWAEWLFSPERNALVDALFDYIYGFSPPGRPPLLDPEGRIPPRRAVEVVADALKTDADWLCILQYVPRPHRVVHLTHAAAAVVFADDVDRALQMTRGFRHPDYVCPVRLRVQNVTPWSLLRLWAKASIPAPALDLYYPTSFDPPLPHWLDSLPLIVGHPMPPALHRAVDAALSLTSDEGTLRVQRRLPPAP